MHALSHRLDHLPADTVAALWRLVLATFSGFSASWERLMASNAPPPQGDDILWDDGEPEGTADNT